MNGRMKEAGSSTKNHSVDDMSLLPPLPREGLVLFEDSAHVCEFDVLFRRELPGRKRLLVIVFSYGSVLVNIETYLSCLDYAPYQNPDALLPPHRNFQIRASPIAQPDLDLY